MSDQVRSTLAVAGNGGAITDFLRSMSYSVIPALLIGHTACALLRTYQSHKHKKPGKPEAESDLRDVYALLPWNKQERFWTTLISVNAGFSEEISSDCWLRSCFGS